MKTVLVYKAQDILIREVIVNKLRENGIETFGSDSSINVVYPNTPNLYLGGASAIFEGYRILVEESDVEKASALIKEIVAEEEQGRVLAEGAPQAEYDHARMFYLMAMISTFIPGLAVPLALYHLYKAIRAEQTLVLTKTTLSMAFLIFSILVTGYLLVKEFNL